MKDMELAENQTEAEDAACAKASRTANAAGSKTSEAPDRRVLATCEEAERAGAAGARTRRVFAPFENAEDVFCSQNDQRWAEHPYWERDFTGMACGLCSFTTAVNILTGTRLSPVEVYDMRAAWGLPQKQEGEGDICACDAHEEFNPMMRELFGVESSFLEDKSLESFARTLEAGDCVIWFSSRDWGEPWIWADGSKCENQYAMGHLICAWKHENGLFYIKDPNGTREQGNNVAYNHEQFERLLQGVLENRYVLRAV